MKSGRGNKLQHTQICNAAWLIWNEKNVVVFGGEVLNVACIAGIAVLMTEERAQVCAKSKKLNLRDMDFAQVNKVAWKKPSSGWFKVNFGFDHITITEVAADGFVVQDWKERLLFLMHNVRRLCPF